MLPLSPKTPPFPRPALRAVAVFALASGVPVHPALAQEAWHSPRFGSLPIQITDWLAQAYVLPTIIGTLVLIAAALLIWQRMRIARREIRRRITGLKNGPRFRAFDAMVHAVWRNRRIDEDRLRRAHGIARDMTDMDFTIAHIREAAMRADRLILPTNFLWMREGLEQPEKLVIFNATVSVLLADGPLTRADRGFLRALTRGLGLGRRELRDLGHLIRV